MNAIDPIEPFEPFEPTAVRNPFSLMMEPEAVIKAMERSTALRGLRRHKLHPLDKPLIPYSDKPINPMRIQAEIAEPAKVLN
jgi:hypothetical protein